MTATGANPQPGDEVALHFSVATPTGQQHFRTQAKIARLTDSGNGIGVQFDSGMPQDAFDTLIEFAKASGMLARSAEDVTDEALNADAASPATKRGQVDGAAADGQAPAEEQLRDTRIKKGDAEKLRKRMRTVMQRALQRVSNQFFESSADAFLIKARDAGTNAVQTMYMEGLDQIEKRKDIVQGVFIDQVLRQIDEVSDLEEVLEKRRRRETGNTSQKLELVDTDQFEEWLAIAEVISKAENRYTEELLDLRAQLGLVAKPWSHKDVIPVGPAVISWAFDDAIKELELRRNVKQDVYKLFEDVLVPILGNIYGALSTVLEESRVFPSVEELRNNLAQRSIVRNRSGVRVDPEAYQEMDAAVREVAMAADGVAAARVDQDPFNIPPPRQAYDAARSILGLGRRTRELVRGERDELLAEPNAGPDDTFASADILDALAVIEAELGDATLSDTRLKPRLIEVLKESHGDHKAFTEEDFDTLDVMENLVESIQEDRLITEGIREWVQRLEITLNKLAARDPRFLESDEASPHSAVMMLNQLARLGNQRDVADGIDREVGRKVDELLQKVVTEYDDNPEIFDEVVTELNPLVDKQTRAYRGNIERTVRASEGQQKLGRARKAVLEEMEERLGGQDVPDLLVELLNPGWRNLLVHTHLRRGVDSNEWRDGLAIVDQLQGQLSGDIKEGSAEYVDPEQLLKRVVEGLNSISFDPSKRTPLVMNLSSTLVGDTTGKKAEPQFSEMQSGEVEKALGLEGLIPEIEPEIDSEDDDVRSDWDRAVARARRIQVGEWLATSDADGRPLILNVAFVGDDSGSFVLVNRKGIKNRELVLKDMADGLHEGRITLLDDYDLPLMERASQRMLENMHNELAYQATHDDLTQLMNRKEFERSVETAIQSARKDEQQHVLLYLDLDQFKIVNNTSGHSAGDELLRNVGDALTQALQDENAQVARLGGDEFGVLVEQIETARARDLAEELLTVVRDMRFDWDGRHYTLSASMGLVFVDQTTESVDSVMQYADEACYTAKDAGRNRLQEYELGDTRMMARHGVMEWVTQLDKALDEDRLVLNCQRIEPVVPSTASDLDTHYEILLTMRDELGDMMPPTDFIIAAETYNRMTTIDRWVIERVLAYMTEHRDKLDDFGGFSVNVSGHSVNDETFPDFVLEQFSKTQAPTGKVCFEITETAAIANLDNAVDFMNRMKIIGCKFSLDDFGTGLSSYSYLRNLPVDYVKIDGVFVKDIANNPGDYAVVKSINEIGHYMGKKTIAEFVENEQILESLREIGVDYAQGYQIEKPLPLAQLKL